MNWFKKQLSKIFSSEEEQYPEQHQQPTTPPPSPPQQAKGNFTFPLIPDNEEHTPLAERSIQPQEEVDNDTYDIENPGISEILAARATKKTVHRSKGAPLSTDPTIRDVINAKRAQATPPTPKEVKSKKSVTVTAKPRAVTSERKTPFKATDVPSPVHGFYKPTKLSEKLAQARTKQIEESLTINERPARKLSITTPMITEQADFEVKRTAFEAKVKEVADISPLAIEELVEEPLVSVEETETETTPSVEEVVEAEATPPVEEVIETEATAPLEGIVEAEATPSMEEVVETEAMPSVEEVVETEATPPLEGVVEAEATALVKEDAETAPTAPVEDLVETELTEAVKAELTQQLDKAETEAPQVPREKIRPFNVIMLASDKEKLAQKKSLSKPKEPEVVKQPRQVYQKPPVDLLIAPEKNLEDTEWMEQQGIQLVEALSHFQVTAEVVDIVQGPAVTRFEITIGQGTKVNKIRNLADDLKLALAAKDIRIEAPIPGKSSIGIEIPNRMSRPVRLSEIIGSSEFMQATSPMQAALGLDLTGQPISLDLRTMPHGLIAGATGSGKSVCINSLLVSLLYKAAPDELRLMLIDPKFVELASYNDIPHLVTPVITDPKVATSALKWAVTEMENRYKLLSAAKVRSIERYNQLVEQHEETQNKMPYMLIIIDELADLMQSTASEVEEAIGRLAQKARACGIHIIVATQRPSVDVITGVIKANIPTRIAFSVSSQIDSRTILDEQGAERLLGKGDMLYSGSGMSSTMRLQGTFVTDEEIERVVAYVKTQGTPHYIINQEELAVKNVELVEQDELYEAACHYIYKSERASASALQRQFSIGYNRAARIIDMLEEQGLISGAVGSKPRDVYITQAHLDEMFG